MLSPEERSVAERLLRVLGADNDLAIAAALAAGVKLDTAQRALADAQIALEAAQKASEAAMNAHQVTCKRYNDTRKAVEEGNRAALSSFDISTVARADELFAKEIADAQLLVGANVRGAQADVNIQGGPNAVPNLDTDVLPRDSSVTADPPIFRRPLPRSRVPWMPPENPPGPQYVTVNRAPAPNATYPFDRFAFGGLRNFPGSPGPVKRKRDDTADDRTVRRNVRQFRRMSLVDDWLSDLRNEDT